MKKYSIIAVILLMLLLCSCRKQTHTVDIAATTLPVYEFTCRICEGTDINVSRLITENVSCLHDYSLHVNQMRMIESADAVFLSGAGLESFMDDALSPAKQIIDVSQNVDLIFGLLAHDHNSQEVHGEHHHEADPHIWLSPANAKIMSQNIYNALTKIYPAYEKIFARNLEILIADLSELDQYGKDMLSNLQCREIITFHDGFSYLAEEYRIEILEAVEEESGSEASAAELIHLIRMINEHHLTAIFTETNGSTAAASIIAAETGIECYELDMAMSGNSYFEAMYHNFDTLREALQ